MITHNIMSIYPSRIAITHIIYEHSEFNADQNSINYNLVSCIIIYIYEQMSRNSILYRGLLNIKLTLRQSAAVKPI